MAKSKKPCPGSKIRSKGKGRGKGTGKGKGPIRKNKRMQKKKLKFFKYWYSPEDETPIDRGEDFVVGLSEAARKDIEATKENISGTWPRLKKGIQKTGAVTRRGAGYIKDTPDRWQRGINKKVEKSMENWEQAQQPMSPEEYQQLMEEYEPPTPEYPPPQPMNERQLYQNRYPRQPPEPEYPTHYPDDEEDLYGEHPEEYTYYRRKQKKKKTKLKKRRK